MRNVVIAIDPVLHGDHANYTDAIEVLERGAKVFWIEAGQSKSGSPLQLPRICSRTLTGCFILLSSPISDLSAQWLGALCPMPPAPCCLLCGDARSLDDVIAFEGPQPEDMKLGSGDVMSLILHPDDWHGGYQTGATYCSRLPAAAPEQNIVLLYGP